MAVGFGVLGWAWREEVDLVGAEVAAQTVGGPIEGMLLSCTARSAWIVVDDADHVVALPHLRSIHRR